MKPERQVVGNCKGSCHASLRLWVLSREFGRRKPGRV